MYCVIIWKRKYIKNGLETLVSIPLCKQIMKMNLIKKVITITINHSKLRRPIDLKHRPGLLIAEIVMLYDTIPIKEKSETL